MPNSGLPEFGPGREREALPSLRFNEKFNAFQSTNSKRKPPMTDSFVFRRLQCESLVLARTRLFRYQPYERQLLFHAAGATCRERLLTAGNQCGKTTCGACEAAMHLTGLYPTW